MKNKIIKNILKGLKLLSFGLVSTVVTASLTYFIAPSTSNNNSKNNANEDNTTTHSELLLSKIANVSNLGLKSLNADIYLPDNDNEVNTTNHISLNGDVTLKMSSLTNMSLNLDATLSYDGYSEVKAVKKDIDITYLGTEKNLYLSLTDGYINEDDTKKSVVYGDNSYTSGIKYCVSGTEYDTIILFMILRQTHSFYVYQYINRYQLV